MGRERGSIKREGKEERKGSEVDGEREREYKERGQGGGREGERERGGGVR